jgi:hypothetical protein
MKNEAFGRMMVQLSEEAEQERLDEARLAALHARRERIKQQVITVVVIALYAIVGFKHAEIRDTVAGLLNSDAPEYQSITQLSAEIDTDQTEVGDAATETTDRKGKLKNALKKAKQNAAIVEDIMNNAPDAAPPAPPAPATKK